MKTSEPHLDAPALAAQVEAAYQTALAALLKERTPDGHWVGELSKSALSTATAVMALHLVKEHAGERLGTQYSVLSTLIDRGLAWLADHQNADGGWGDTPVSFSNISTTMLCRSAIYLTQSAPRLAPAISRAESWLTTNYGPKEKWPEAIRQRYGKDRTFATPILTTCSLAGLVSWDEVPPLPFELAVLPQSWFRFVKLHVVSYALPALIAMGQCIEYHRKSWNPLTRLVRRLARARSLRVLESIQPSSGGFLEATPLTSFVTMSLAASGLAQHPVAQNGVRFLVNSVRPDGSWAIDSNLATWVTTLSINALAVSGRENEYRFSGWGQDWLMSCQFHDYHPYTGAAPGGYGWTDLPGSVPDADDTPGALLALSHFLSVNDPLGRIIDGMGWLLQLQNSDGGWPTFCRGWGALPFDRSGADLTAHAIRALSKWSDLLGPHRSPFSFESSSGGRVVHSVRFTTGTLQEAIRSGFAYLARTQRPDGSWLPLWFGNQHMPNDENPTYGTARVLAAYRDLAMMDTEPARKGIAWLLQNQNADGGWGGGRGSPSSIEETALALDVLCECTPHAPREEPVTRSVTTTLADAVNKGSAWLVEQIDRGGLAKPAPIGFYFAKLWYFEKLYPIIFSVSALGRIRKKQQTRI